ncbi:CRAL/TRIO domain-containing protein [Punctularia strigosozonata HHB-11173 SS5]|uniref:CRAL/TRIO domain-containing protein n=1 Tax=Punctularia strigosozonata (strain HHB-11173) TaxID=741275 RepID=UPI00044174D4|nr:CRAL/TRIO domain-containing protein [Punctularia strigosozonata HHB-11173 SS5]EIN09807.1 CRAL/TRIO domain-containing protein [Punctularia strigosozonata HHB-11173 SS5]
MPDYTPLPPPPVKEGFKPPNYDLTPAQEEMRKKVLAKFDDAEYKLPGVEDGKLTEDEQFWLSYECILRYLRASKWVVDTAITRLESTLKWRREFGLYTTVTAAHVEPEAFTGKEIIFGYDVDRRPALYLVPSRQNTEEGPRQIEFVVWMLERTIDLMGPGVETLALLINYADKAKNPSFGTSRKVLSIIQDHYPERLGRALILNLPWLLAGFYKLITPFVDPVTREKMKFNPAVVPDGLFAPDMVMKAHWGGEREFEWEHAKYWPALVSMCEERRARWRERWRKLGGGVGVKEWEYKGGDAEANAAASASTVKDKTPAD